MITPLQRIKAQKGDVYHGIKATEKSFKGFGEAYFSTVSMGLTKGWKCHKKMTLNLIVPVGSIKFYLRSADGKNLDSVQLGDENYARLTVPPGIWLAFSGIGEHLNLLLNVADILHDPEEAIAVPLESFPLSTTAQ